jgi:AcrR family transcriptional regulator
MTVNKVGRPSKAEERMAQILRAMAGVVAKDGLASATLARVAEAAGLQRTLVLHYFGSRSRLLQAFVDEAVAAYGTAMLRVGEDSTVNRRLDAMFAPGAYRDRGDLVLWLELVALGARDGQVGERLRALWTQRWLPDLEQQLHAQYPSATNGDIQGAAYALACLFEAHWMFHVQGVGGPERADQARQAARAVLATLPQ